MKFYFSCVLCICLLFNISAEDFSKFAIQGSFSPFRINELFSSEDYSPEVNALEVGARFKPIPKFGIDIMFGANYNTGYEKNLSKYTPYMPPVYSVTIKTGVIYTFLQGERSGVAGVISFGGIYEKRLVRNYSGNLNTLYDSYKVFSPVAFLGVEPSVNLTRNFVFYTRFGLQIMNYPATKSYEYSGFDYYSRNSSYKLVEKSDEFVSMRLDGFCLGFRYQF